jgi:hypothetical protein
MSNQTVEGHVLSKDCPCGPDVESVGEVAEEVYNTFPGVSDEELARKAVALKAQLFQVAGEMTRRPNVPGDSPLDIEAAIGQAVEEVVLVGFLLGTFDSEHEVLQLLVDGGGSLKGTAFDYVATDTVLQLGDGEHVLSADCPCGPEVESFAAEAAEATEVSA